MLRELGMCVIIIAISSSLAVATNLLRERPLPWARQKLPEVAAATPSTPMSEDAARSAGDDSHEPQSPQVGDVPGAAASAATQGVVTIDEVLEALATGSAYFIDAREKHEYDEGHLRGAIHLPSSAIYQNISQVLEMIPSDARAVVYCGGGQCEASHNVTDALRRDFGYTDVVIYEKGWEEAVSSGRFGEYLILGGRP